MMATAPGDKTRISLDIDQLLRAAKAVHDVESFHAYASLDNAFESKYHKNEVAGLIDPDRNAKTLGSLYLALYIIGSVAALVGQALD